jgi:hypothetical protein
VSREPDIDDRTPRRFIEPPADSTEPPDEEPTIEDFDLSDPSTSGLIGRSKAISTTKLSSQPATEGGAILYCTVVSAGLQVDEFPVRIVSAGVDVWT